jgi:ornithine cyclodeaminase/alanine dehydrogenase-like protein (mu-crystallin family)
MVLVLDKASAIACVDLPTLIDEIGAGMAALKKGGVQQPLRTRLFSEKTGGLLASLPCYLTGDELFCAKLGFSHPTLRSPDGARHLTQLIALGDTEGRLLAIMHGTILGMIRTAACSAFAARYLSQADASHLAVIGCGPMGRAEAEAVAAVRPLRTITVHDINPRAAEEFRDMVQAKTGVEVVICTSTQNAVRNAPLVSLATTSHTPVIQRDWLTAHCHVAALGAHRKDYREVDSDTMTEAAVFIESEDALMAEAGDYLIPIVEGRYGPEHYTALVGALADGTAPADSWAERLTVFKSTGVGIQDLVIARHVHERAVKAGLGVSMDF